MKSCFCIFFAFHVVTKRYATMRHPEGSQVELSDNTCSLLTRCKRSTVVRSIVRNVATCNVATYEPHIAGSEFVRFTVVAMLPNTKPMRCAQLFIITLPGVLSRRLARRLAKSGLYTKPLQVAFVRIRNRGRSWPRTRCTFKCTAKRASRLGQWRSVPLTRLCWVSIWS